ncbi:MAG: RagB/SusD family nutrient uptake outer membrane protein [Prevotella sp.]|nr:RagB/SusD family nutrient uptake outer membrane protein [Prevotella sp.]
MEKTYIYNKVKVGSRAFRVIITSLLLTTSLTSCLDTIILPDDKTVDEDFWQTKEDVSSMVNAAYQGMVGEDVIEQLLVWASRSDELVLGTESSGAYTDALEEMAAVNMQVTNRYAKWSSLYSVINRCNIVLERAEAVMSVDPSYTQGDYMVDRAHMLALRSLCYFYLVRNFRDVPYTGTAYMNSSQEMQLPQSSPAYVLEQCIQDLEWAVQYAVSPRSYGTGEWRRVGWLTQDGIRALLADIYLWRASVTHSQSDYQRCVEYCDQVIASKQAQHVKGRNEVEEKLYPLASAEDAYTALFVDQNAEESIFELQSRANNALCRYYYKWSASTSFRSSSTEGYLRAAAIFDPGKAASNVAAVGTSQVFSTNDLRLYGAVFAGSDESFHVRKMISNQSVTAKTAQSRDNQMWTTLGLNQNLIIYRLTDVMLMRAEALVQLANPSDESDTYLQQAFTMVQAVNSRALYRDNQADSMQWTKTYRAYTKDQMELLVMQERLRELCFEGKRWYDLLRYNYRHVEGVDYNRTFAEQMDANENFQPVANYADMLSLMTRSRGTDGPAIQAKMRNEAYLYLPVPNSDIIVCPLLRQNPAYKSSNQYEKTY